jgi:hypothetical protein
LWRRNHFSNGFTDNRQKQKAKSTPKNMRLDTLQKLSTADQRGVLNARERDADDLIHHGIDARSRAAGQRLKRRVAQLRTELGFSE